MNQLYKRNFGRIMCGVMLSLLCSASNSAEPTADGMAYNVTVTLNGHRLSGIQEMILRGRTSSNSLVEEVSLTEGSNNRMTIVATSANGKSQDVTRMPGVMVYGTRHRLRFSDGILKAPASAVAVGAAGLLEMFVVYAPDGKDKPYGMNEYSLKVVESSSLIGQVHPPTLPHNE